LNPGAVTFSGVIAGKPHPRLRATRLFEMLRARGFTGSAQQVRRFVKTVRRRGSREAFFRLELLPLSTLVQPKRRMRRQPPPFECDASHP
jgi:transposase